MSKPARVGIALAACALTAAAPAEAKTYKCKAGAYGYTDPQMFPNISKLRATLPRKTDGAAEPCEVADAVAGEIQWGFSDDGEMPTAINPRAGEEGGWNGGPWVCTYKQHWPKGLPNPYVVAKCHAKGKPHRRVSMELNE